MPVKTITNDSKKNVKQMIITHVDSQGEPINENFERSSVLNLIKPNLKNGKKYKIQVMSSGVWRSAKTFTKKDVDEGRFDQDKHIYSSSEWYKNEYAETDEISAIHIFQW